MLSRNHAEAILSRLNASSYSWCRLKKDGSGWWTVKNGLVKPSDLIKGPVALRPDKNTVHWLALDIDVKSPYHPSQDDGQAVQDLRDLLSSHSVETLVIQSSTSTGLHLWAPLPEQSTTALANWLRELIGSAGFTIKPGTLELFPGDSPQPLRVPCTSKGSLMLDNDLQPFSADAEAFLQQWDHCLHHNQDFETLPAQQNFFRHVYKAKERLSIGFKRRGQTRGLAMDAAYISRSEGLFGANLQRQTCRLLRACPGYRQHSSHQREIDAGTFTGGSAYYSKQAPLAERAKKPSRHDYTLKPKPNKKRQQIADAVQSLAEAGQSFATITQARLAVVAYCKNSGGTMSNRTTIKHSDLIIRLLIKTPTLQPIAS